MRDAVLSNQRVHRHVGHRRARALRRQRQDRRHDAQLAVEREREHGRRPNHSGEEEVRAAAVAGDGDDVGEQALDGLDDPGGADEPLVELRRRRLHALHVLPVVPRRDAADGVADALAGPVDGHDGEHEAPAQLAGQTPEPAAGEGGAAAGFSKRRVVVLLLAIHLGSDFLPGVSWGSTAEARRNSHG